MDMCDAIVRSAGMENLQKQAEMTCSPIQGGNRLDCRPEFIDRLRQAIHVGNEGFIDPGFTIWTPFIRDTKDEIVRQGHIMHVDYSKTWSCYIGGDKHCGRCGTCVERIEAFQLADVPDPTEYEKQGGGSSGN